MAPELQTVKKSMCFGLSAATGGLLAVLSDIAQKQDASAVEHLQTALAAVMGLRTYPAVVAVVLIALAVALSFIFSTNSNKKAFYIGASILAIMMTAVPYNGPPSLSATPTAKTLAAPVSLGWWDRLMMPGQAYAQSAPAGSYAVDVHVQTDDGKTVSRATFTLVDSNSGEVLGRSREQSGDIHVLRAQSPLQPSRAGGRLCHCRAPADGCVKVGNHPTDGFGSSRRVPASVPQVTGITRICPAAVVLIPAA